MGNAHLTPEQLEELKIDSKFSEPELQRLFRRFRALDTDSNGCLSVEEFMAIPELEHNPLGRARLCVLGSLGAVASPAAAQ